MVMNMAHEHSLEEFRRYREKMNEKILVETNVTDEEFFEAFNIGLIVGGSITIPHLRYAVDTLEECRRKTRT